MNLCWIGFGKPDKRVFEALLAKCDMTELHSTSPESILFIGNETDADIVGGRRMGWKTALFRTTGAIDFNSIVHTVEQTSNGLAHWEIDTLEELHDIIWPQNGMFS